MKYIKIDLNSFDLKEFYSDLYLLFIEIDNNGIVKREIGLNNKDLIIHKYPNINYKYGLYGIFDLQIFDINSIDNELSEKEFNKLWGNNI